MLYERRDILPCHSRTCQIDSKTTYLLVIGLLTMKYIDPHETATSRVQKGCEPTHLNMTYTKAHRLYYVLRSIPGRNQAARPPTLTKRLTKCEFQASPKLWRSQFVVVMVRCGVQWSVCSHFLFNPVRISYSILCMLEVTWTSSRRKVSWSVH